MAVAAVPMATALQLPESEKINSLSRLLRVLYMVINLDPIVANHPGLAGTVPEYFLLSWQCPGWSVCPAF